MILVSIVGQNVTEVNCKSMSLFLCWMVAEDLFLVFACRVRYNKNTISDTEKISMLMEIFMDNSSVKDKEKIIQTFEQML